MTRRVTELTGDRYIALAERALREMSQAAISLTTHLPRAYTLSKRLLDRMSPGML